MAQNPRIRAAHSKAQTPAMLQGVIRCAHCDSSMTRTSSVKKHKKYRYYTCVNASKRGYDSCPVKSVSALEVEKVVFEYIRKIFKSPELFAATKQTVHREFEDEINRLSDKQTEIKQSITGRDELSKISSRLQMMKSNPITDVDILQSLENIESIWDELFPAEQARIVSLIFHKILVYSDGIELYIRVDGFDSFINELVDNEPQEVAAS